ncbi:MAG: SMC-Scp complex subunit ScpB [Parcubacteria group bacterium]|nr:SMC-Scp complex subunit ScpB [Parcubacteria group bacterium]
MDKEKKYILESLIFTSGKPIKIKKLAQITKLSDKEVKDELNDLNEKYKEEMRGMILVAKDEAVQMVSNPEYGSFVESLVTEDLQEDLSKIALETLSIIAYRGPITRAEIELIRGVSCIYILRNLMIRGLIEKTKSEEDSRKSIYQVSFKFLRHLGVSSNRELPDYEKLSKEILVKSENQD